MSEFGEEPADTSDDAWKMVIEAPITILLLIMTLGANFVGDVLPCPLRRLLQNRIWKHIWTCCLMYFFLVAVSNEKHSPLFNVVVVLVLYVWFLISIRSSTNALNLLLVLLISQYMLYEYAKYIGGERSDQIMALAKFVAVCSLSLPVISFVMRIIESQRVYGSNWQVSEFLLGVTDNECLARRRRKSHRLS